jgi:hypothetical protein
MCFFNPGPERRVPSPNRYIADAKLCLCKNNKRMMMTPSRESSVSAMGSLLEGSVSLVSTRLRFVAIVHGDLE